MSPLIVEYGPWAGLAVPLLILVRLVTLRFARASVREITEGVLNKPDDGCDRSGKVTMGKLGGMTVEVKSTWRSPERDAPLSPADLETRPESEVL